MLNNLYTFDQVVFLMILGILFGMVSMMLFFRLIVAPRLQALSDTVEALSDPFRFLPPKR